MSSGSTLDELQSFASSRIPTLVQCCQRVASANVDLISSLGDEFRFDLIKPVLEGCSAETLARLERTSPCMENDTAELWKAMCLKTYPLAADSYRSGENEEPTSWRDQFYVLRAAEAKRFEELGSRLRNQRIQAEERKKEREVKLTDKLPSQKRQRTASGWGSVQPKTLIQKTRSEASKIQRMVYTTRVIPPMPRVKDYRASMPSPRLLPPPPPSASSCVQVKTTYRKAPYKQSSATSSSSSTLSSSSPPSSSPPSSISSTPSPPNDSDHMPPRTSQSSPKPTEPRAIKSPAGKKDPMSALFMPKHRAHSQRPGQLKGIPAR